MRTALLACTAIFVAAPAWAAGEDATIATTGSASAASAQTAPAPGSAEERDMLLQEIRGLRDRVTALENRASQVQYSPEMPQRHKLAGDNNFELYGFVQLDAIQDFKRVHPDWDATLRPSRIPTTEGEFGSDGQTLFSVRQSRLGAKANGMLAGKPYEAKFEFDLFGTGVDAGQTTFRVRHMYGSWGPILVGQTNTLWMDADIFPNVVDYWGPPGMVFVRNPQIRFTFLNRDGFKAAIALENPSDDIDPGAIRLIDPELATNVRPNEELPDLTAMVRYGGDWGHVQLGGILRKIGFDTVGTEDNEPEGSETGWGVSLSGSAKVSLATFRLGVVHGRGIATYMNDGGMDLAPSANLGLVPPTLPPDPDFLATLLEAEAVKLTGISAYVDLQWTKQLSSALGYSFTKVDNTNFQEGSAFHKGSYASGNLLWMPADRILAGVELLWGKREDNDGDEGTDFRMQSTFKFSFSSKDIWD
ncbi:MAG TPA: DcaP family trimeric outer membrane transporter [Sphingomicrobium sp.]|nr:DcaP family trimeric outer membrane transporter [Sphingomicrobium sp.]